MADFVREVVHMLRVCLVAWFLPIVMADEFILIGGGPTWGKVVGCVLVDLTVLLGVGTAWFMGGVEVMEGQVKEINRIDERVKRMVREHELRIAMGSSRTRPEIRNRYEKKGEDAK